MSEIGLGTRERIGETPGGFTAWMAGAGPLWIVVAFVLLAMPWIANEFVLVQIFGWAMILGSVEAFQADDEVRRAWLEVS